MVGTLLLADSRIWDILAKQELPDPHMWTVGMSEMGNEASIQEEAIRGATLIEGGEDALDIGVNLGRGRFAHVEVALVHIAGTRCRSQRAGQGVAANMFIVGATINVYHIARAMLHCPQRSCSDQTERSLRFVEPPTLWGGRMESSQNGGCGREGSRQGRRGGWA